MKKVILSLVVMIALALGAVGVSAQSAPHNHRLTITNKSGVSVLQVYLTLAGDRSWGTDWLDDDEWIPNADYRNVDIQGHRGYDFKATKSAGKDCLLRFSLDKDMEITIYRDSCYVN